MWQGERAILGEAAMEMCQFAGRAVTSLNMSYFGIEFPSVHTEKSFRNLIKSTQNQIVFTIFWFIWNKQTDCVRFLFQINRKMVNTTWFEVFSPCAHTRRWYAIRRVVVAQLNCTSVQCSPAKPKKGSTFRQTSSYQVWRVWRILNWNTMFIWFLLNWNIVY